MVDPSRATNGHFTGSAQPRDQYLGAEWADSTYPEDAGFVACVAHFSTEATAEEAKRMLHGKMNSVKTAPILVEVRSRSYPNPFERRSTIDGTVRTQNSSASSNGSLGGPPPERKRYNSLYPTSDKTSPPLPTPSSSHNSSEFPVPEASVHMQNLFSSQSPHMNGFYDHRRTGKSTINDDNEGDEETGRLISNPVAFAANNESSSNLRSPNNEHMLVSQMSRLNTNDHSNGGLISPTSNGLTSPSNGYMQPPMSPSGPNGYANQYNGAYDNQNKQLPPNNPADQNPPCNTLYVGNLPHGPVEEELKQIFSHAPGWKRLLCREKPQNSPMAFVEFEDITFATRALQRFYGTLLRNSVRGGIRLSYSKNPLGQRGHSGNGGYEARNPNMPPGLGAIGNGGQTFSGISGPPPGLSSVGGFATYGYSAPPAQRPVGAMDGHFSDPWGLQAREFADQLHGRTMSGGIPPHMGAATFGAGDGRNGIGGMSGYSNHYMQTQGR
ncbi:cell cycle RNA binding protein whi3 [Recurvomyces mirabilis]|nr:cell cycle RNA binding protein whi3 [Recurvomyces mirabilis]